MNKYANQMANDAKDMKNEAANRANDAIHNADNKVDSFARRTSDVLDHAEERAYDIAKAVGAYVQDLLSTNGRRVANARATTEDTIKTHPLTSAAVAFTAGMILASLLGSGRR